MKDIQHSQQGRSSDNHEPKYRVLDGLIFPLLTDYPLSAHGLLRVRQSPLQANKIYTEPGVLVSNVGILKFR